MEWHKAGDFKTLKCMYIVSKGATSKVCIQQEVQSQDGRNRYKMKEIGGGEREVNFKLVCMSI